MRGSVNSRHSFVFIMLHSSLFHELIIFFCSLRIYFPTSFSFACFSHCLFFVCSELFFCTLSLYISFLFLPYILLFVCFFSLQSASPPSV